MSTETSTRHPRPPGSPCPGRGLSVRAALSAGTLAAALLAPGCQPSLPAGLSGRADPAALPREPEVALDPQSPFDAAPPVLRAHIFPEEGAEVDASRVLFVRGHVGDGHVRQVEHGDLSQALQDRILPSVSWSLDDGSVVLAPALALDPGVTYGVLSGDPPLGEDIRVLSADAAPLLRRVWPPPGAAAGPFAVLCGEGELAPPPPQITVGPGEIEAAVTIGAVDSIGERCLRINIPYSDNEAVSVSTGAGATDAEGAPRTAVPPPVFTLSGGELVRLDPAPISLGPPPVAPEVTPLDCPAPGVPFGPGCARVADDRVFITTPDAALLWAVRTAGGAETVRATQPGEPWVLHGLTPGAATILHAAALDAGGRMVRFDLSVFTSPPLPHVVISEVLANPLGPEPDQEWIELVNDGLAAADLAGYVLGDIGGETALPPALLEPGARALLVNETFVEDDEIDPPPAPGTLLLRVPKLGKDGLKNDGEPLKLVDAAGEVVSRFPPAPRPKAGQSVARVSPAAPDGVASSFFVAAPTPGAPNSPP